MKRRSSDAVLQTLEEGVHEHHSPEKVMWLCVILQQLLDATKPVKDYDSAEVQLVRDQAEAWIFSSIGVTAQDRDTVCYLAGVEPAAFKSFAKKVLKTKETVFIRKRINAILHEDSY
tara:strand:+ start:492 stop:842 length:351 start_codon:yes stop_codon:yes gene_type:complete